MDVPTRFLDLWIDVIMEVEDGIALNEVFDLVALCLNCRIWSLLFFSVAESGDFEFPDDPVLCGVLFRVWECISTLYLDPLLRRAIIQA